MSTSARRVTFIWAGLVLATVASWLLGVEHAADDLVRLEVVAVALMVITAVKSWYVGLDFMELRHSARWLRALFTAWLATTTAALSVLLVV